MPQAQSKGAPRRQNRRFQEAFEPPRPGLARLMALFSAPQRLQALALFSIALSSPSMAAAGDGCRQRFEPRGVELQVRAYPGRSRSHALLISRGERALNRVLGQKEANVLERAHFEGQGEAGKDSSPARAGNYTPAQLKRKIKILKEAFPLKSEREALVREAAAGALNAEESSIGQPSSAAGGRERQGALRANRVMAREMGAEETIDRLTLKQIEFLGQTVASLKQSLELKEARREIDGLQDILGVKSAQPVAALASAAAIELADGREETEPFRILKRLLEAGGLSLNGYFHPWQIEELAEKAQAAQQAERARRENDEALRYLFPFASYRDPKE